MTSAAVVHVVLNDDSFVAGAHDPDVVIVERLARAIQSLQERVSEHDSPDRRIVVSVSESVPVLNQRLGGGATLSAALGQLGKRDRDLAARLKSRLTSAMCGFNKETAICSHGPVRTVDVLVAGASRAAWTHDGVCWSADHPAWQKHLEVERLDGQRDPLANLWSAELDPRCLQRHTVARVLTVLPDYEDPGHHDPDRSTYVSGKAHIPRHARRILRHALPETKPCSACTTWWAYCEHEFYHRFQGPIRDCWPLVHWNGTTNPRSTGNRDDSARTSARYVPMELRKRLVARPAKDCGCREV